MRVSTLSARWFGFSLFLIAVTVGCAQPGTGVPAPLTSPSSLSVPSAAAVGPSASYDATGCWRFVEEGESPFVRYVSQDSSTGNLSFLDEDFSPIILERLSQGTGAIITYRISLIGDEGGECDIRIKGTVVLDTTTNTLTGRVRLKELGCSNGRLGAVITATKISCPA